MKRAKLPRVEFTLPGQLSALAGAQIAPTAGMPEFSMAEIVGGLLFGSIGFVAFIYGKRMNNWKPMLIGLALMAYPYFASDELAVFGIGTALTAALFFFRG